MDRIRPFFDLETIHLPARSHFSHRNKTLENRFFEKMWIWKKNEQRKRKKTSNKEKLEY